MTTTHRTETDELYREFAAIETDHDLFELRPDGVPIWERLRFDAFRDVQEAAGLVDEAHDGIEPTLGAYLEGCYGLVKHGLTRNPYLAGEHDYLFYGRGRRKRLDDGYWWDVCCDPILQTGALDALLLEAPYDLEHRTPARTETLAYADVVDHVGTIRRKAGLVDETVEEPVRSRLAEASEALADAVGAEVDLVGRAERALEKRAATLDLHERLLARVDPAVAVVVMSYRRETFVEACQRAGIPVVELQHGVIHGHHLGYHFPGDREKEAFPDYLLTFGEYWKGAADYPIDDANVLPVGYPYLEWRREAYRDVEPTPQVLFVSQGTVGSALSKLAVELSESTDRDVAYKLHPGEYGRWRESYPWLAGADVRVVDDDSVPLYRLFAESSVQVGVGSTAIYEGLEFDLRTFLVDLPGVGATRYLVERGFATLVDSAAELAAEIERERTTDVDSSTLFEPNAVENAVAALEEIRRVGGVRTELGEYDGSGVRDAVGERDVDGKHDVDGERDGIGERTESGGRDAHGGHADRT